MMLAEVHEEMGNLPQALSLVNYGRVSAMAMNAKLSLDKDVNRFVFAVL